VRNSYKINKFFLKLVTLGPVGDLPASGTFGSLCALFFVPLFVRFSFKIKLLFLILIFLLGFVGIYMSQQYFESQDPKEIVFDEFIGQFVTFALFSTISWKEMIVGFLLFRTFDILKPWPISYLDKKEFKTKIGILLDDLVAGLFALFFLMIFHKFIFS